MRSKHFLRGMGFGILVTVIIFAVALVFYEPTISDEEIEQRAKALGMVMAEEKSSEEDNEDAKDDEESSEEKEDESSSETTDTTTNETTSETTDTTANETTSETTDTTANETTSESTDTTANEASSSSEINLVTFIISSGEGSSKICENLYRAGLIDDPNTFNTYLEQNGYDKTISTGSYEIPEGSSYEEIANTISK
ncbi:MAG: hypothetical protein K5675_02315 [Lachnospiraceae bacterium]|nr:hypothetical protein [Lachnospiraceae bacterium]